MTNDILINIVTTLGCITGVMYTIDTLKYDKRPPLWYARICQWFAISTVGTGAWFIVKNMWGL